MVCVFLGSGAITNIDCEKCSVLRGALEFQVPFGGERDGSITARVKDGSRGVFPVPVSRGALIGG